MSDVPKILYKFLPKSRCDFFDTPMLRFSPISTLNDLFEGKNTDFFELAWEGKLTTSQAEEMKSSFLSALSASGLDERLKDDNIDVEQFNALFLEGSKAPQVLVNQGNKLVRPQHFLDEEILKNIGVLCLSGSIEDKTHIEKNILMWAHYTNNEGFAIGFDSSHSFFTRINKYTSCKINKVIYQQQRPISLVKDYPNIYNLAEHLLYIKSEHWAYENEWRLLDDNYNMYKENNVTGLCKIQVDMIKEVVLAVNCSKCLTVKASEFCQEHSINLYQLYLEKDNYSFKKEYILLSEQS